MSIRRSLLLVLVAVFALTFAVSLLRTMFSTYQALLRTHKTEEEVKREELKKQDLTNRLNEVLSLEFIEREARNKLLMVREGETLVVLPAAQTERKNEDQPTKLSRMTKPQLWRWLFFGR